MKIWNERIRDMETYKRTIGPEEAKQLLAHNHAKNRNIGLSTVHNYARQMKEGLWNEENPQPIILTQDGLLLDGQHRLSAVIEANQPVTFTFTSVPDDSVFEYLDQGKRRTAADFINVPNQNSQAAIAKVAFCIRFGEAGLADTLDGKLTPSGKGRPGIYCSREETLQEFREEQSLIMNCTAYALKMRRELGKGSARIIGSFIYLMHFLQQDAMLLDFVEDFLLQQPKRSATQATKDFIKNVYLTTTRGGHNRENSVFLGLYQGYQKFCTNVSVRRLSVSQGTAEKIDRLLKKMRTNYHCSGGNK